jgi:hypothetical protein
MRGQASQRRLAEQRVVTIKCLARRQVSACRSGIAC